MTYATQSSFSTSAPTPTNTTDTADTTDTAIDDGPTTGYPRAGPAAALGNEKQNSRRIPRERRRIIGVSTKMYFSAARTDAFIRQVVDRLLLLGENFDSSSKSSSKEPESALDGVDVFIIPDFLSVREAVRIVREKGLGDGKIVVGAQDCWSEDHGAYTGEVSPRVLKEVGCGIVELGHAERKKLFGETDGDVRRKVEGVWRNGMCPLVCVGEIWREGGVQGAVEEVMEQVEVVLGLQVGDPGGVEGDAKEVVLAYEPVWAIGAEEPASAEHVKGVVRTVRGELEKRANGLKVRIIYGGSAGPGLWEKLDGEVDGLFLGRFGHHPEQFIKTVCEVAAVRL